MILIYSFKIRPELDRIILKLERKNKYQYEQLMKKITEIINSKNINHYKNLRKSLQHLKRVHIGHFVLVFSVDESSKTITFENYKHHDEIYK